MAIGGFFPEHGEWWASHRIAVDLANWLKDSTTANRNLPTQEERTTHAQATKKLLEKYGPENWPQLVDKELAANFVATVFADDIQTAAAAEQVALSERTTKMVFGGALLIGGIVLFTQVLGKRK